MFNPKFLPSAKLLAKVRAPDRRFVTFKHFANQSKASLSKTASALTNMASASLVLEQQHEHFADATSVYSQSETEAQLGLGPTLEKVTNALNELVKTAPQQKEKEELAVLDPLKETVFVASSPRFGW
jgi:hypothetical protein